jgi:hypothetical protein
MQFNYAALEKKLGMHNYNPDLNGELIGIVQEYDRIVAKNNSKIFTGVLEHNNRKIKYPKTIKERLQAQRFATSAKLKIIENFKELYSAKQIISAINGFKP